MWQERGSLVFTDIFVRTLSERHTNLWLLLPSDWYLDEVLLLAMPRKDGWGGLADGPRVMEVVVSR